MLIKFFNLVFKFYQILDDKQKNIFILLIISNLVSGVLELLFIALLAPIFNNLSTDGSQIIFFTESLFINISEFLIVDNNLIFKLSVILSFVIIKNIFFLLIQFQINKFSFALENKLSTRIIESVLNQNLIQDSNSKSTDFIKNTTYDSHRVNIFFSIPLISFISDLFLVIFLLAFLINIQPKISLIVISLLGLSLLIFHIFTNRLVVTIGKKLVDSEGEKIEIIKQIFDNLSFIRLSNSRKYFIKNFEKINLKYLRYGAIQRVIQQAPKYFYELLLFLTFFIIYMVAFDESIISYLAILIATMYKLLPSLGRLSASYQSIYFSKPSLDEIYKNLQNKNEYSFKYVEFKKLSFENIDFYYEKKRVLNKVSFEIEKNSFVGIKGVSGSGKSTLLSLILKLNEPTSGRIFLNGKGYKNQDIKIGYVSQNIRLLNTSIRNNIAFGIPEDLIDFNRINQSIVMSELESFIKNLDNGINSIIGENGSKISGGQIQRIAIARSIYTDPDMIIFDESTNSLDSITKTKILKTLKKISKNRTVIYVTHEEENDKYFDKIINIENGKINIRLQQT